MEKKLLKAGLASHGRAKEEISSLREKVQQQQQQIKKLTRALADSDARRDSSTDPTTGASREPVAALHAEIASLEAENRSLKSTQNSSLGGVFTRSPTGAADTRAGYATLRECPVAAAIMFLSSC